MKLHRIFLLGMPGAGKSTHGTFLAKHLDIPFYDLDDLIEESVGKRISQIFDEEGEEQFRIYERQSLINLIEQSDQFVVACGGGTPCFFDNLWIMKEAGTTIYLDVPFEILKKRIKNDEHRPLLMSDNLDSKILTLFENRKEFYEQAEVIISDDPITVDGIIARL